MRTLLALALAVAATGCGGKRAREPIPAGLVTLEPGMRVMAEGQIGAGVHVKRAAYVLVDARSHASTDLYVALEGDLLDASGKKVGDLAVDSLRVPPGGVRTFALVHTGGPVPSATSAEVRVVGASPAEHPAEVDVTDGKVERSGSRVVVTGTLVNHAKRQVYATVIAGFHDAAGHIMSRPFTVLEIAAGASRQARFEGPDGSADGYLFVGEELF